MFWIMLWMLVAIVLFSISPAIVEGCLVLVGRQSNVIPFFLFYTVPAGAVMFVIWVLVAAWLWCR